MQYCRSCLWTWQWRSRPRPVLCNAQSKGNNRTIGKTNFSKWVPGCEVINIFYKAKRVTMFSSIPVWYGKLNWNSQSWPQPGEPPHWNRLQGFNVFKILWNVLVQQQLSSSLPVSGHCSFTVRILIGRILTFTSLLDYCKPCRHLWSRVSLPAWETTQEYQYKQYILWGFLV